MEDRIHTVHLGAVSVEVPTVSDYAEHTPGVLSQAEVHDDEMVWVKKHLQGSLNVVQNISVDTMHDTKTCAAFITSTTDSPVTLI